MNTQNSFKLGDCKNTMGSLKSKLHISELDGIRGIAVLMVVIWHYITCEGAAKFSPIFAMVVKPTLLFWSGVDLFFVLSGFLIGGILLDHCEFKNFYKTFYIRRAMRILPVYMLLLALFFLCRAFLNYNHYGWLFDHAVPDLAYLTFTQNIYMGFRGTFGGNFLGVTWSLAVEEQFYLLLPFLLLLAGSKKFKQWIIILIIVSPFLRLAFPGFGAIVNMPFRMDSLLTGTFLSIIFRSEFAINILTQNKSTLWGIFVVLLLGIGVMTQHGIGRNFLDPSAIAFFYAVFITLAILHRNEKITAILRSKILTKLGMYSYGIYMYHQMVSGILHGYFRGKPPSMETADGIVVTLASLILTIILAIISYHTFEAYFLAEGKRYSYEVSKI